MTCVFDALLREFRRELKECGVTSLMQLQNFIRRESNTKAAFMGAVTVNGEWLTSKFVQECVEANREVSITCNGYNMSTCDPLLIFMAARFRTRIKHYWRGAATYALTIVYDVPRICKKKTVVLRSSASHMS